MLNDIANNTNCVITDPRTIIQYTLKCTRYKNYFQENYLAKFFKTNLILIKKYIFLLLYCKKKYNYNS